MGFYNNKNVLITNEELYGKNLLAKDDLNFIESNLYKASELMLIFGTRKNARMFIKHLIINSIFRNT